MKKFCLIILIISICFFNTKVVYAYNLSYIDNTSNIYYFLNLINNDDKQTIKNKQLSKQQNDKYIEKEFFSIFLGILLCILFIYWLYFFINLIFELFS